jgi:glycerophosphoryl diester phosphodiesterase
MYNKVLSIGAGLLMLAATGFAQSTGSNFNKIKTAFLDANSQVVLVAAHRGAHLEAPENSIAAFQKAIDLGIDIIELDVRCTKDGVLVCMHDRTVNRTTNGKGPVDSFTFAEIRQLRLKHQGKLTDEQIPTLEEALMLAKGKILVDLDIKAANCIEVIMETVVKTKTSDNCFFFLGEPQHVQMLKGKNPAFQSLLRTNSAGEVDTALGMVKTEAVHIDPSHHTAAVVNKIKGHGARVWINALGEVDMRVAAGNTAAFEGVLKEGANIIQTDQPALLKAYLVSTHRYHQ